MTLADKERLFEEWVQRLGLERWHINACLDAVPGEFELSDVEGECHYQLTIRAATIRVLRDEAALKDSKFDFEKVFVHELLHLKFALIYPEEAGLTEEKQSMTLIEDLAVALVDARRAK